MQVGACASDRCSCEVFDGEGQPESYTETYDSGVGFWEI
jgi:hypothetical protein